MKKKNLLLLAPIALSAALFLGYRTWDRIQTDITPPEISISTEDLLASVSDPKSALLQGITARDDRDGDVTDSLLVENLTILDENGTIAVAFAAFDQSGNVSKGTRNAQYTDYERPRFYLNQPLLFAHNSSFDLMAAIRAQDPLDGNIQHRIRATSQDDATIGSLGDHQVEFRVTNSLGDTVRLTLPVTVYAADTYGLEVKLTDYLVYLEKDSKFRAGKYLSEVKRGLNTVSFEDGTPDGYQVRISSELDTAVPGVYPVDYTVTYIQPSAEGKQYITGISRLIVIVEE